MLKFTFISKKTRVFFGQFLIKTASVAQLKPIHSLLPTYQNRYRTRAIISRGLYIVNPFFEGQKRFFKEFFSENFAFMFG